MDEQSENQALREIVAQALAAARKTWPTMDGSPVYELFAADAVLDALGLEPLGALSTNSRGYVNFFSLADSDTRAEWMKDYPDDVLVYRLRPPSNGKGAGS